MCLLYFSYLLHLCYQMSIYSSNYLVINISVCFNLSTTLALGISRLCNKSVLLKSPATKYLEQIIAMICDDFYQGRT